MILIIISLTAGIIIIFYNQTSPDEAERIDLCGTWEIADVDIPFYDLDQANLSKTNAF